MYVHDVSVNSVALIPGIQEYFTITERRNSGRSHSLRRFLSRSSMPYMNYPSELGDPDRDLRSVEKLISNPRLLKMELPFVLTMIMYR